MTPGGAQDRAVAEPGPGGAQDRAVAEPGPGGAASPAEPPAAPYEPLDEVVIPPDGDAGEPGTYIRLEDPREQVRKRIAYWLLTVIVSLTIGLFVALATNAITTSTFTTVLAGLFTPILGVFGTVTGFYFGTHASEQQQANGSPRS